MDEFKIDPKKVLWLIVAIQSAFIAFWFGEPIISGNTRLDSYVMLFYSSMAGWLMVISAFASNPEQLPRRNWRAAFLMMRIVAARTHRLDMLLMLYLMTMLTMLLREAIVPINFGLSVIVGRAALGFAAAGMVLTLSIPGTLHRIQQHLLDRAVERQKEADRRKPL